MISLKNFLTEDSLDDIVIRPEYIDDETRLQYNECAMRLILRLNTFTNKYFHDKGMPYKPFKPNRRIVTHDDLIEDDMFIWDFSGAGYSRSINSTTFLKFSIVPEYDGELYGVGVDEGECKNFLNDFAKQIVKKFKNVFDGYKVHVLQRRNDIHNNHDAIYKIVFETTINKIIENCK